MFALLELKESADQFMTERHWNCRLVVKVHFGPVAAGKLGADTDRRYDLVGKTVNVAARLDAITGFVLSADAFSRLGPEVRRRFKQPTVPVTYIRQGVSAPPPCDGAESHMR